LMAAEQPGSRQAGIWTPQPVLSPDSTKILYMSDQRSPGSFDILMMNADGSHKRLLLPHALLPNWGVQPANELKLGRVSDGHSSGSDSIPMFFSPAAFLA